MQAWALVCLGAVVGKGRGPLTTPQLTNATPLALLAKATPLTLLASNSTEEMIVPCAGEDGWSEGSTPRRRGADGWDRCPKPSKVLAFLKHSLLSDKRMAASTSLLADDAGLRVPKGPSARAVNARGNTQLWWSWWGPWSHWWRRYYSWWRPPTLRASFHSGCCKALPARVRPAQQLWVCAKLDNWFVLPLRASVTASDQNGAGCEFRAWGRGAWYPARLDFDFGWYRRYGCFTMRCANAGRRVNLTIRQEQAIFNEYTDVLRASTSAPLGIGIDGRPLVLRRVKCDARGQPTGARASTTPPHMDRPAPPMD